MNFKVKTISVSVVIPCFRCASTIERAVLSVVQQTMKPAELILVDDSSDDDTLTVLEVLRHKYGSDWIKITSLRQNGGVSVARNAGWDQSSHDYIAFLDSDDEWHPRKIEIQYTWMIDHDEVALSGHQCVMLNPGARTPFVNFDHHFTSRLLSKRRMAISNPFVTPSFMVKRDLQLRFDPSSRYAEDFLFLLQLSFDGYRIAILDIPLVYIFKQFGVSGLSGNLFKMRYGDLKNYWKLWRLGKIGFLSMGVLIMYSSFKFILLLLFGPNRYGNFIGWLNNNIRHG